MKLSEFDCIIFKTIKTCFDTAHACIKMASNNQKLKMLERFEILLKSDPSKPLPLWYKLYDVFPPLPRPVEKTRFPILEPGKTQDLKFVAYKQKKKQKPSKFAPFIKR